MGSLFSALISVQTLKSKPTNRQCESVCPRLWAPMLTNNELWLTALPVFRDVVLCLFGHLMKYSRSHLCRAIRQLICFARPALLNLRPRRRRLLKATHAQTLRHKCRNRIVQNPNNSAKLCQAIFHLIPRKRHLYTMFPCRSWPSSATPTFSANSGKRSKRSIRIASTTINCTDRLDKCQSSARMHCHPINSIV